MNRRIKEDDLVKIIDPLKYAAITPIENFPPIEVMEGSWRVTSTIEVQGWLWVRARSGKWQFSDWSINFQLTNEPVKFIM